MAGFSRIYVIGGQGGFMGADGVNPIEAMILVGDAHRQWLEARLFRPDLAPLGSLRSLVPAGPDDPHALLDACIAFCPQFFADCPSLPAVERDLVASGQRLLDFDAGRSAIPTAWRRLREEALPRYDALHIWIADLKPMHPIVV